MSRSTLLAAVYFVLSTQYSPAADWPLFRGDPRMTGVSASKLPDKLDERWTFKCQQAVESATAIAGGVVYVASADKHLYALDLATGNLKWKTQLGPMKAAPAVHKGREADGIRLEFKDGRVVDASAEKGEEFLIAMLDQDAGARVLGEIAIGTNYSITEYTKNTLFDEKIGGTFHAAVGMAYPESGGKNESGLHWDMVCDLRRGGTIEADGEVFHRDGKFLREGWPGN